MCACFLCLCVLLVFVRGSSSAEPRELLSDTPAQLNCTSGCVQHDHPVLNLTESGSRISTILRDLPTIKTIVIFVCVLTTLLVTCLVIRVYRSGKKIRKTRKYDIITTPAERVEMAPLNEENDEDDDSTLFDVKYR